MDDTFDVTLRTAVYRHFATTGQSPTVDAMREALGATTEQVTDGYRRLYAKRMLVPAGDFRIHPHGAAVFRRSHAASGDGERNAVLRKLRVGRIRRRQRAGRDG